MPYTFRPAVESDVQAIADIYNASVMAGGATADLTPRTFDQRRAWVESHTPPYGVFVVESEDGSIIGFGALSVRDMTVSPIWPITSIRHGKAGE